MSKSSTSASLHNGETDVSNDALHASEAAIDRMASQAKDIANRGIHAASKAGTQVQRQVNHYAEATGKYVAEQPVKSVLIAAATGAALAALLMSTRRHNR